MNDFLTALVVAALYLAFCADYPLPKADPVTCPCGCGNPIQKHNRPRRTS